MSKEPRRWDELTTVELDDQARRGAVAVVPLAAIEQHGPHLPLSTDRIIGEGVVEEACSEAASDVPLLILPTLAMGTSPEHAAFGGTLSLDAATLETTLFDVGASVARAGIRRLVVVNSHGGNRAVVDVAALRLRTTLEMLVVKAHTFRFPPPDGVDLPGKEWTHGLHGGAVETAIMLHLRPDLVRQDAIRSFPSLGEEMEATLKHLRPEGPASFAWTADDLNPGGVVGDATLARAEMGKRFVTHYAAYLADILRDTHRFPLDRLAELG
ncbi:MAG: creatininase family protein [Gemmatimonadetes bacterium]|nr:creatininase family protein [Gemmatimonadota bacterium]